MAEKRTNFTEYVFFGLSALLFLAGAYMLHEVEYVYCYLFSMTGEITLALAVMHAFRAQKRDLLETCRCIITAKVNPKITRASLPTRRETPNREVDEFINELDAQKHT
jgi:hypothetical protein